MRIAALLASVVALGAAAPAPATVLYKSVASDGSILFSDTPPPDGARLLEQRTVGEPHESSMAALGSGMLMPAASPADPGYDDAVARANQKVDLAEHALALAREGLWSPRDGLSIEARRMTRGDEDRVAFYKRGVNTARRELVELLRERQLAAR
jgi:hypothetical protein